MAIVADNVNDLWRRTLNHIVDHGHSLKSRVGSCTEILGYQARLTNPLNNIVTIPARKFSLAYASAELLWYLSGTNDIDMISAYAPQYKKFAERGKAYGAYGYRWKKNPGFVLENSESTGLGLNFYHQLDALVHLLRNDPNTRQAVITMWDSGDLIHAIAGGHKDLPCTLALNFFIRENKLHLIATMRSNDSWLGLPYDVFCFTYLQRIIASMLQLDLGDYIHQAGSEHIYSTNMEKVTAILDNKNLQYSDMSWTPFWDIHAHSTFQDIQIALQAEENLRVGVHLGSATIDPDVVESNLTPPLNNLRLTSIESKLYEDIRRLHQPIFRDLVLGVATKWLYITEEEFDNPLFKFLLKEQK